MNRHSQDAPTDDRPTSVVREPQHGSILSDGKVDQSSPKEEYDDIAVGIMAVITMTLIMRFMLMQVPVAVFLAGVTIAVREVFKSDTNLTAAYLSLLALIEAALILYLVRRGKLQFKAQVRLAREAANLIDKNAPFHLQVAIRETHLEWAAGTAAVVAIAWCFLIGGDAIPVQLVLTVTQGFALLILTTFIIVRFIATKKIRPSALVCYALTALSLWGLFSTLH